jgi:hypothetical protein
MNQETKKYYRRGLASKLSYQAEKRLIEAYFDGIHIGLIRDRFHVHPETISRVLRAHGFEPNRQCTAKEINWYGI